MNFSIQREELLQPLQSIGGIVEKRQTLPILSHVLISVEGGQLSLVGTDLEVEVKITLPLEKEHQPGIVTVPARKFLDISKALPDGSEIQFQVEKNQAAICSGKSYFSLSLLPADDFPQISDLQFQNQIGTLTQSRLSHLLQKVSFSMAVQDVRYYLNGILLEQEGDELRLVATDGHRLAFCGQKMEGQTTEEKQQIIIPRKAVQELGRLLQDSEEPLSLSWNENHLRAEIGQTVLVTKLIDGAFPEYERVIPKQGEYILAVENELFRQSVNRVSILSNEKYRGIRLSMSENQIRVHANNPEQEEAEEEISASYQGKSMEIGFNAAYLMDALSAVESEEVSLYFIDENSSCLIQNETEEGLCKYVVMPIRL